MLSKCDVMAYTETCGVNFILVCIGPLPFTSNLNRRLRNKCIKIWDVIFYVKLKKKKNRKSIS